MPLQIIVPMPHHWALFHLAQSAKNITDPKKETGAASGSAKGSAGHRAIKAIIDY
jgi:hypothetical protein